jgi:hypothetical protein
VRGEHRTRSPKAAPSSSVLQPPKQLMKSDLHSDRLDFEVNNAPRFARQLQLLDVRKSR